jgi:hypothetical protein
MRFILVVMVAVALTLTWQTTISAKPIGQCDEAAWLMSDNLELRNNALNQAQSKGSDELECR